MKTDQWFNWLLTPAATCADNRTKEEAWDKRMIHEHQRRSGCDKLLMELSLVDQLFPIQAEQNCHRPTLRDWPNSEILFYYQLTHICLCIWKKKIE